MKQQPTKVTPGYNVMWESSRMMLPEHKAALLRHQKERDKRDRPELDEQSFEETCRIIQEAAETGHPIRLVVYDPYQDVEVVGHVQMIDQYQQRIRLAHNGKKTWVPFVDILQVERF